MSSESKSLNPNWQEFHRIGLELCKLLELKTDDPNTKDTPERFADFWMEFSSYTNDKLDTVFPAPENSGWVIVRDIKGMSICEHHLLPFIIDVTIGYKPKAYILGLSKFARIAKYHAHRPQTQERLGNAILDHILRVTVSNEVFVIIDGFHLCMYGRGIESEARTKSVHVSDSLKDEDNYIQKISELVRI